MALTHWSRAGAASAATLTAAERRERGRRASAARWGKVRQRQEAQARAIAEAAEADQACYGDLSVMLASTGKTEEVYATLQQRKKQETLPGRNPYQIAQDDPARRWSKSIHDLLVLMRSVRDNAGGDITLLTQQWSPNARESYRTQLEDICMTLEMWILALKHKEPLHATERTLCRDHDDATIFVGDAG